MLCLHGKCQTAYSFKFCSRTLQKKLNKNIGMVFVNSPYGKSWYPETNNKAEIFHFLDQEIIDKKIKFLMGFSQGGTLIDDYLKNYDDREASIDKVVIISGRNSGDTYLDIDLLNIYSHKDDIVPFDVRPTAYRSISEIEHDRGHIINLNKNISTAICDFINS